MPLWHRKRLVVLLPLLLLPGAGCSSGTQPQPTAATTPTPTVQAALYDTFEKIGDAVGCLSLSNSDAETTDIKDNKYCALEKSAVPDGGTVTVYEYADKIHRDKSIKAGVLQDQSFLLLSETWSLSGDVRDLRRIKALLGDGELRSADPEEPTGPGTVRSGEKEEPLDSLGDAEPVAFGKSVTLDGEQVQSGKIYCNDIGDKANQNKQYDSCRQSTLDDSYGDTTRAPKGDEFFLVAFRWKNVGKKPIEAKSFGTLVTQDGTEYELNENQSTALTRDARGNANVDMNGKINPGKAHRILLAYTIPKGTKVKAINWGAEDYTDDPPVYALAVK
jgi:hypothetical protein